MLRSAVNRPKTSIFQVDAFPTLSQKAAAYLDSLARNHPFIDGNKRIAYVAAGHFLQLNSRSLKADTDSAEAFVLTVITAEIEIVEIAEWLDEHCAPCQHGPKDEKPELF
jgi:death-on-curing protein